MVRRVGTARRARAAVVALALALGVAGLPSPAGATDAADPEPAPFTVRGSVGQLAILDATPGVAVELVDGGGATVAEDVTDDFGSLIFRDVAPGTYTPVVDGTHGPATAVVSADATPPRSLYDDQVLDVGYPGSADDGFGYLTTRDGTTLAVTVRLPGPPEAGPYPTVIEYSGYDPANPDSPEPSTLIAQALGYATVGVNMRGTGCSGGSFFYFEELQSLDGYDVVETVAAQPWVAHGAPGMVGISYPGISQLFTAATRPPSLAAIAPLSVIADTYRSTLYPGGIPNDGFALSWARGRMNDARPYGQGWEQRIVDRGGAEGAECARNQLLRLQNPDLLALISENPYYEVERGDPLSPITFVDRIDVPVFLAGAWQDEQTGGHFPVMLDGFTSAPSTRFTLTNGTHVDSLFPNLLRWSEFLDLHVARRIPRVSPLVRAAAPAITDSVVGEQLVLEPDRFTHLASYEEALAAHEAEPAVRVLFENGWGDPARPGAPIPAFTAEFSQWPPAETVPTTWYVHPDQRLAPEPPTVADDSSRATTSYRTEPEAITPERTLPSGDPWRSNPPYRWEPIPPASGLVLDGPPLTDDVVMVGSGSVDLWLRSSAADTDLEVQLVEVRPDGQERFVQGGWLRASHRHLDDTRSSVLTPWHTHLEADAEPLTPGVLTPVRVELFPFAHVFRTGSSIRLTIDAPGNSRPEWTFASHPTGGEVVDEVAHSVSHPSRVVLPVIPDLDVPASLPACPSLRSQPCRVTVGNARPTSAAARALDASSVEVTWAAPADAAPGEELAGYEVVDVHRGGVTTVGPEASGAVFDALEPGRYAFSVEARYTSGAGSGPSTPSEDVEVLAPGVDEPDTFVTSGPPYVTADPTARVTFTSDVPGATFRCALDFGPDEACVSPWVRSLAPGYHLLTVAAVDAAGVVDPSPAVRVWYVDDSAARCRGLFGLFRPGCIASLVERSAAHLVAPWFERALTAHFERVAAGT